MFLSVMEVCSKHEEIWNGLTAFSEAYLELQQTIKQIREMRIIQETDTKSVTVSKKHFKDRLTGKAFEVAQAVCAYATVANNGSLHQKLNFPRSTLVYINDLKLIDRSSLILQEARQHVEHLAPYGVNTEELDEMEGLIEAYKKLVTAPRDAISYRAEATARLEELFDKGSDKLSFVIDRLMVGFAETHPEFYSAYKRSRHIIRTGRRFNATGAEDEEDPEPPVSTEGDDTII